VTLATKSIKNIETCKAFNKVELENLNGGSMSSKTSDAARYEFDIGYARFTVIDTPGFGDSRGMETDAENFEKIKKIVLDEQGINCVCVIQNGREPRMNTQLKYNYTCLIDILPKKIADQIMLVYTNCRDATEMTFDHLTLNETFDFPPKKAIPFVCIDNPLHYVFKEQEKSKNAKLSGSETAF
jgi:hypothetical protein